MGKTHACGDSGLRVPGLRGQEKEGWRDEEWPGAQWGGEGNPKAAPPECCAFYLVALPCPHLDFSTSSLGSGLDEPGPASPTSQARPPRTALQDVGAQPAKTAGRVQISYILRWVGFLADLTESSVQVCLSP